MTVKKKKQKESWYLRSNKLILGCVILLLAFFLFYVYRADRKEVSNLADETISFLETVCQRYDNYALGQRAASLKDMLDKAEGLRDFISEERLENVDFLEEYANNMGLSGIVVTDEEMNFTAMVDLQGKDPKVLWESYLSNKNKRDSMDFVKKSFSGRITEGEDSYDIAIVGRKDSKGLILCYVSADSLATDLYEVSLEQTLTNNTFHKNPRIVITDGTKILAANIRFSRTKDTVVNSPIVDASSSRWKYGDMIRLRWNGESWYGKRQVYGIYYIYVFYPAGEVFADMFPVVTTAVAVYAVLCMIMMILRRKSEKKYLERERKQLSTIRAISSLYATSSILHLEEMQFEPIQLTERSQKVVDKEKDARIVVRELAEKIIAPELRGEYVELLNPETLGERLKEKGSLSKVFKDVNNVWHSVYLVAIDQDRGKK